MTRSSTASRGAFGLSLHCIVAIVLLAAGTAVADDFEHPSFASGAMRPTRVLVLPPRSTIVRARLTDSTELIKETALLERSCAESIAAALDSLGYDGDASELEPTKLAADRELLDLVATMQDRVDDILGVAVSEPKDMRIGRFTIGEEVLPLAARTKAEGFLIVQARAIIPSRGRRTLAAMLSVLGGVPPIPPTNTTSGIIVLVDARTGDLAWLAGAEVAGAVAKEPDVVGGRLGQSLMKSYPAAGEVRKQKRRKGSGADDAPSVPEVASAGPGDTESVLAAFESAAREVEAPPLPEEEAPATPAPIEDVSNHQDFQGDTGGPISAATPTSPSADPPASGAAIPVAPPPTPEQLAAIRALWDAPAESRAVPTRQVVLQMLDGGPGLVVRNMSEPAVRVSVNLNGWTPLEPGERRSFDVGKGSHRILVTNADGVEVARISCLVGATALCNAEIWPKL